MTAMNQKLAFKLKNMPKNPGVYIFKNSKEGILYIGKAKNLFKRVNSYFQKDHQEPKTGLLVPKISDVDFTVTDNEVEALILELNLIKEHQPVYNIEYKDDKSYPYIAITLEDSFPRIAVTREAHKKGVKYFGPYVNATALRQTIDTLRSIFPLRTCRGASPGRSSHRSTRGSKTVYTPCLNFHIERCPAPCNGKISAEDYRKTVNEVLDFLEGKGTKILKVLEAQMKRCSARQQFERASRIRDRIVAAQMILNKQKMASESGEDIDIFGAAAKEGYFCVALFMIRDGNLIGSENFQFQEKAEEQPLLSSIKHYYHMTSFVPKEILLAQDLADSETLQDWLRTISKTRVQIKKPQKGKKKRLVELANKNALHNLDFYLKRLEVESHRQIKALKELKEKLNIKMPYRIECFDISNIAGKQAVGSMVVFENAQAKKAHYRKFKVRFDDGANDYKMMAEVIGRRLKNLLHSKEDASFKTKPDLIIVDGGKGQLSAAKKVLDRYGDGSPSIDGEPSPQRAAPGIAALAKKQEELFIPNKAEPIILSPQSPALNLVKAIRDEAHRFAIQYHRKLRSKQMLSDVWGRS